MTPTPSTGGDARALERLLAKAMHPHAGKPSARARLFALLLPKDRETEGLLPGILNRLATAEGLLAELSQIEAGNPYDMLGGVAGKTIADFKSRLHAFVSALPADSLGQEETGK